MMNQAAKRLAGLCTVIYFVSYLTRHNYAAVLAEIIASGIASDSAAAVTTVGFITYGCGQLISGFLGDRILPQKLIFSGLLLTTMMNLILPLCQSVWQMCLVWGCNGFAQAFLWPPMVKLLSVLNEKEYHKACTQVTIGAAVGTIAIYCLVPLILIMASWQMVFFICASFGAAAVILWKARIGSVLSALPKAEPKEKETERKGVFPAAYVSVTFIVLLAIIAQGILRDGITTWAPVYLYEVYHLSTAVSILITVSIPILSIIGIQVTAQLYNRVFQEERKCAGVLFLIGAVSALLLTALPVSHPAVFAAGAAVITACMHGVNLMLITVFPLRFKQFGRISLISGLLNFSVYVGSAISSIGFEKASRCLGWHWVVALWAVIAAVGTLLCWIAGRKKFPEK